MVGLDVSLDGYTSDYFDIPMSKTLCFMRSAGLLREQQKKGKYNRPLGHGARAKKAYPSYIHSFIH
jgi:hypothetical protein